MSKTMHLAELEGLALDQLFGRFDDSRLADLLVLESYLESPFPFERANSPRGPPQLPETPEQAAIWLLRGEHRRAEEDTTKPKPTHAPLQHSGSSSFTVVAGAVEGTEDPSLAEPILMAFVRLCC